MWKESFKIGVDRIDTQHEDLFRALGAAQRSLHRTVRASDYKQHCMNTLYFLKNYVKQHFYDEESYLESTGFAGLEEHKQSHANLATELSNFEKRVIDSNYDASVIRESLEPIIALFIHHVMSEDQKIPKGTTSMFALGGAKKANTYLDQISDDIASKTEQVLKSMAGFDTARAYLGAQTTIESDICFRVNLVGEVGKAFGFIYSRGVAFEAYKYMSGNSVATVDAMVLSALNEMSCIIAGKVSDAIVASGVACDIEAPTTVSWDSFPKDAEHIMVRVRTGDMIVLFFDK